MGEQWWRGQREEFGLVTEGPHKKIVDHDEVHAICTSIGGPLRFMPVMGIGKVLSWIKVGEKIRSHWIMRTIVLSPHGLWFEIQTNCDKGSESTWASAIT